LATDTATVLAMLVRAMLAKLAFLVALIGHAAAFGSLSMAVGGMGRREIINSGLAAASAAPILANFGAEAALDKNSKAPIITVFDHRGCTRAPKEYTGPKSNNQNDEMCIKVESRKIDVSESSASKALEQMLGSLKKM